MKRSKSSLGTLSHSGAGVAVVQAEASDLAASMRGVNGSPSLNADEQARVTRHVAQRGYLVMPWADRFGAPPKIGELIRYEPEPEQIFRVLSETDAADYFVQIDMAEALLGRVPWNLPREKWGYERFFRIFTD